VDGDRVGADLMPSPPQMQLVGGVGAAAIVTVVVPVGIYEHLIAQPTNAVCNITFNTNGTTSVSAGVTGPGPENWMSGGSGASYWVRWTNTTGTLTTGTAGTWQQLSTARTFGVTFTTNAAGSKPCVGTVDIATDSGGVTIVATGSIDLKAECF